MPVELASGLNFYPELTKPRAIRDRAEHIFTSLGVDDKSNALYYFKLAMRYKDQRAALKYLDQYFEYGGTGKGIVQSFASLNPMYGFTGKNTIEKGQEFVASLSDNEKEKLKTAQDYFDRELDLPMDIKLLLGKKDITDVEAKNLLTKYVKSKIN